MWYPIIPITATTRVYHTRTKRPKSLRKGPTKPYIRLYRGFRPLGFWSHFGWGCKVGPHKWSMKLGCTLSELCAVMKDPRTIPIREKRLNHGRT